MESDKGKVKPLNPISNSKSNAGFLKLYRPKQNFEPVPEKKNINIVIKSSTPYGDEVEWIPLYPFSVDV